MKAKYFANAVIRFTYGQSLNEGELHLCRQKPMKAEDAAGKRDVAPPDSLRSGTVDPALPEF